MGNVVIKPVMSEAEEERAAAIGIEARRLEMNYIGVLTLLGRIAQHLPGNHADRHGLDRAYADANRWLEERGRSLRYEKASKGYAAFECERPAVTESAGQS